MMDAFLKDFRHSVRMFLQTPGFTIAAIAALTLGIGTNTAIFSVVDTVLLKPFSYPDPDDRWSDVARVTDYSVGLGDPHARPPAVVEFRDSKRIARLQRAAHRERARTMEQTIARSTAQENFNMLVLTIFGCSAMLLAAIGIYGLMAYSVGQRSQEIGIRLALGAGRGQIRKMIMLQGLWLALIGVIAGLAAAFGLTRLIAACLYGVKAWDPLVFVTVPAILIVVAAASIWLPAVRASRVDPVRSLRYE
jgi:ABC-type lipoprotein release transport system permease subunit